MNDLEIKAFCSWIAQETNVIFVEGILQKWQIDDTGEVFNFEELLAFYNNLKSKKYM